MPTKCPPTISAGFFSAAYYPLERLKAELSFRTEYTSLNRKMNFSPRLAVNYYLGDMMLSGIVGRYTQLPENDWLVRNRKLMSEVCMQYNLGMQYGYEGRFYKAELYYKDYIIKTIAAWFWKKQMLERGVYF